MTKKRKNNPSAHRFPHGTRPAGKQKAAASPFERRCTGKRRVCFLHWDMDTTILVLLSINICCSLVNVIYSANNLKHAYEAKKKKRQITARSAGAENRGRS